MRNFFARFKNKSKRGDTIVEVLISIAIIAVVVAIGYTISNRSLQTGTSADQRNRALALAQGQVEQLVNAQNLNTISKYPTDGTPFCISNNGDRQTTSSDGLCHNWQGQPIDVAITYTSGVFTIKAQWSQTSGNKSNPGGEGQLSLYYKTGSTQSTSSSSSSGTNPPTVTTLPATNITYTSATLNGNVVDNDSTVTNAYFEWGVHHDPVTYNKVALSSNGNVGNIKADIASLTPDQSYDFRACVNTNPSVNPPKVCGDNLSFTTSNSGANILIIHIRSDRHNDYGNVHVSDGKDCTYDHGSDGTTCEFAYPSPVDRTLTAKELPSGDPAITIKFKEWTGDCDRKAYTCYPDPLHIANTVHVTAVFTHQGGSTSSSSGDDDGDDGGGSSGGSSCGNNCSVSGFVNLSWPDCKNYRWSLI